MQPDWRVFAFQPIAFGLVAGALYFVNLLAKRFQLLTKRLDLLFLLLVTSGFVALGLVALLGAWLRLGVG